MNELSRRINQVLDLDHDAPAFEFEGEWHTWGELRKVADQVAAEIEPGERVPLILRNHPVQLTRLIGLLACGACVVALRGGVDERQGVSPGYAVAEGVAVEMLTSGTTGPPKHVPLTYDTFLRVLLGAKYYERNQDTEVKLRSGVVIVNAPLAHLSGLFRVLQCVFEGRSFCLLEKFEIDTWVDAVRRHRPKTVSLVPAALRMVLDAGIDPADLASVKSVISGTAPLSPDDADAFQARYGIPVLTSYAATEFGGGVAGWNLADHERWWKEKRGSVGRAHPGCELRVADGVLEVKARQLGTDDWVRTTDLARIDDDGFVFILGRADQAIIRGGFKVLPDTVKEALEADPRVRGAAVVGKDDQRLGAVPVAAVELRAGVADVTADDLLADAAKTLARYELPVELRIVDELPRTPSGKVELAAVKAMFA